MPHASRCLPSLCCQLDDDSAIRKLHSPEGPVAWALATVVAQGSKFHARLLLMFSSQLSTLIILQPAVMSLYPDQIRSLLLTGGQPKEGEC